MSKCRFEFISTGKPVLILSHGFLGSNDQWQQWLSHLHKFDILFVELPGHGSNVSSDQYTFLELAVEVALFMESHHIKQVLWIGHSMGGYLGSAFAKAYPEKITELVLINSIAGADTAARKQLRNRAIQLIDRFQNAYVSMAIANLFSKEENENFTSQIKTMKARAKSIDLSSVLAALRVMRDRESCVQQLADYRVKVRYILGKNDSVIEPTTILKEVEELQAPCDMIDGGHMLLLTHPNEVLAHLPFVDN